MTTAASLLQDEPHQPLTAAADAEIGIGVVPTAVAQASGAAEGAAGPSSGGANAAQTNNGNSENAYDNEFDIKQQSQAGRIVLAVLVVVFAVSMFYASGGMFIIVNLINQITGVQAGWTSLWSASFPLQSALGQFTFRVGGEGAAVTNQLPFFAEAVPFFLVSVLLEAALAVVVLRRKGVYRLNDSINSLSVGIMSQVCGIFFAATSVVPYLFIYDNWAIYQLPESEAWVWWIMFFAIDFCYYWFHRVSHEHALWWGQHVVHHSSEEYNLTTALRQASIGGIGFVFYLPLAFFLPISLASAHKTFNLLYQFWIHTKLIGSLGPLEWVLNTPTHHSVHHARNPYCIDKNYAGTLIIWDRMFGTFAAKRPDEKLWYGKLPPLDSFNPVWANFQEYWEWLQTIWRTPGWRNRLSFWRRGPGWGYDAKQGKCRYYKVPKIGHKMNPATQYDPHIPTFSALYGLSQFICVTLFFFIVQGSGWTIGTMTLVVIICGASLTTVGWIFEAKPWAMKAELVRLVVTIGLIAALLAAAGESVLHPLFGAVVVVNMTSILALGLFLSWDWIRAQRSRTTLAGSLSQDGSSAMYMNVATSSQ